MGQFRSWPNVGEDSKAFPGFDWREALLAILLGNAVYFFALEPRLPESMHHEPFRIDLGLLMDFVVCAVLYIGLRLAKRR